MIGVLDYGLGNPGSILNMLKHLRHPARPVGDAAGIDGSSHLIIPGVGAFDRGIALIEERGLRPALDRFALASGRPLLGICLGMQLMTRRSDEGALPGLGWIATETTAFSRDPAAAGLRIPHMGWSGVAVAEGNPLLAAGSAHRFYFVHSFRVVDPGDASTIATCRYGSRFIAAFHKGNLFGVQFHPEKSHRHGMRLLTAFAALGRP